MSKESKIAKKEAKAAKKAAKAEKNYTKSYNSLVKKINKKNAKLEKKCAKKGKPFVPIAIPEEGEPLGTSGSKGKKIVLMIILILLIWLFVYFIVMWVNYTAPALMGAKETTTAASDSAAGDVSLYVNKHDITTTPNFSISEAKALLKQTVHDNWQDLGYSSDPSSGSISYNNSTKTINNDPCYVFSLGNKTYYVSVKLRGVYQESNGQYKAIQNNKTDMLY